jgi:hypothetical protein
MQAHDRQSREGPRQHPKEVGVAERFHDWTAAEMELNRESTILAEGVQRHELRLERVLSKIRKNRLRSNYQRGELVGERHQLG